MVGLDLTRFLAGSRGIFGEPETLVLRLRPLPEIRRELGLHGDPESLERFRSGFMLSPWVHAVDAFDMELEAGKLRLGLAYACTAGEAPAFFSQLQKLAEGSGCRLHEEPLPEHRGKFERLLPLSKMLPPVSVTTQRVTGYLGQGAILLEEGKAESLPDADLNARMAALLEGLA